MKSGKSIEIQRENDKTYGEMSEVDDGPGDARGAVEDGENKEPREEEDQDVSRPHTRVREPLRVPIHIRRRKRSNVHPICLSPEMIGDGRR